MCDAAWLGASPDQIVAALRAMYDPVRARGVQNYFKNEIVALGITTPALREFANRRVKELRAKSWTLADAIRLCDCLLREPEMDIRSAGILVLAGFSREFTPALLPHADRWLGKRLDNWALVDSFSGSVLAPLLKSQPQTEQSLSRWSGVKSMWHRRAALVTLVPFARRGQYLDLAYSFARKHFSDTEDLMHKATGWLLREAGKTDMGRLRGFLLQHGPSIPRTALRYAIERFAEPERTELLESTRK